MKSILTFIFLASFLFLSAQDIDGTWNFGNGANLNLEKNGKFTHSTGEQIFKGKYSYKKEKESRLILNYEVGDRTYIVKSLEENRLVLFHPEKKQELTLTKLSTQNIALPDLTENLKTNNEQNKNNTKSQIEKEKKALKDEGNLNKEKDKNSKEDLSQKKDADKIEEKNKKPTIPKTNNTTLPSEQEIDINRARIGFKFLIPNIVGLNAEFIPPILANRLGIAADYSYIPATIYDKSLKGISYNYFALNSNIYLGNSKEAKGVYIGLVYHKLSGRIGNESVDAFGYGATFGIKTKGPVYFNFEMGATKANIPLIDEFPLIPILNIGFGVAF